uniref:Uncharacterized protein n=1 Tax=Equus caballus TaxID=9796 RepID=A0A9L0RG83_HORSE
MLNSLVPELRSRPKLANQAPPRRQMVGDTATVSTLATVVGQPNTPVGEMRQETSGSQGVGTGWGSFPGSGVVPGSCSCSRAPLSPLYHSHRPVDPKLQQELHCLVHHPASSSWKEPGCLRLAQRLDEGL